MRHSIPQVRHSSIRNFVAANEKVKEDDSVDL